MASYVHYARWWFGLWRQETAETIDRLLQGKLDDDPAPRIRRWLQRNARKGIGELGSLTVRAEGYPQDEPLPLTCEDWEYELVGLALTISAIPQPKPWSVTPKDDRKVRAKRIARLARELASEIGKEPAVPLPSPIALLSDDLAVRTAYAISERDGDFVSGKHLVDPPEQIATPPARLAFQLTHPDDPDEWPDMLERLACMSESQIDAPYPVPRLKSDTAVRVFANRLHDYVLETFGAKGDALVADCIALHFPDLRDPPDSRLVAKWRQARQHPGSTPRDEVEPGSHS